MGRAVTIAVLVLCLFGCTKRKRYIEAVQHAASETFDEARKIAAENKARHALDPVGDLVTIPRYPVTPFYAAQGGARTNLTLLPGDIRLLDGKIPDWDAMLASKPPAPSCGARPASWPRPRWSRSRTRTPGGSVRITPLSLSSPTSPLRSGCARIRVPVRLEGGPNHTAELGQFSKEPASTGQGMEGTQDSNLGRYDGPPCGWQVDRIFTGASLKEPVDQHGPRLRAQVTGDTGCRVVDPV
jgi:hypothetical protein